MDNKINWKKFFILNLPLLGVLIFLGVSGIYAQNPQGNPFGTRGDTAIGGFGKNALTILNALTFFGGMGAVFMVGLSVLAGWEYMRYILGAVICLGGWTAIGGIAWGLGNNQAFQIPGIT